LVSKGANGCSWRSENLQEQAARRAGRASLLLSFPLKVISGSTKLKKVTLDISDALISELSYHHAWSQHRSTLSDFTLYQMKLLLIKTYGEVLYLQWLHGWHKAVS
jgi:hypothetical protein